MGCEAIFAALGDLSFYNWVDIAVALGAVVFAIYGIMHGITGGISKLIAYLTTFGIGVWCYNFIRGSWLVANTYPNKIGAFIIGALIGLIVGVCAYFAYNYLVGRVNEVMGRLEMRSMEFLDLLYEPAAGK